MKGLILKDFYQLKVYWKQYGFIFGAMFLYSLILRSPSFAIIYLMVMGSTLMLSSVSMDESVSFNKFAFTMPINLRMMIKSKYILFLSTIGIGIMGGILLEFVTSFMPSDGKVFVFWGIKDFVVTAMVFVLSNSVTMPAIFRLGVEKARYINIFIMLVLGGFLALSDTLADKIGLSGDGLEEIFSSDQFVIVCIIICVISLIISYFVTIKLAEKKEW